MESSRDTVDGLRRPVQFRRHKQTNESSPGTPAEASGTEGRRRDVRDARGRFARKSEKSRSGFKRTQGIREWRAKRELEFDENDPPNVLETRTRKVRRVHFEIQEI